MQLLGNKLSFNNIYRLYDKKQNNRLFGEVTLVIPNLLLKLIDFTNHDQR